MYRISHESIVRVLGYLEKMKESEDTVTWNVPPNTSSERLAYLIRQAMKSATVLDYKQYKDLQEKFMIRARPGRLIAERRSVTLSKEMFRQSMSSMVIEDVTTIEELLAAAIKYKADEMHFPNVILTPEEMSIVFSWAEGKYYIVKTESGIVLTKSEEGRKVSWNPTL